MNLKTVSRLLLFGLLAGLTCFGLNALEIESLSDTPIFVLLAVSGFTAAFLAVFFEDTGREQAILFITAGIVLVVTAGNFSGISLAGSDLYENVLYEIIFTFFLTGHAAMLGTFASSLIQKVKIRKVIKVKNRVQEKLSPSRAGG